MDLITLILFILDIVANFVTSYIDLASGEEITDPKLIAKHYILSSVFVIDILSTFPLDIWFQSSSEGMNVFLKMLGILKIQRLRRISKLIANLSCSHETKALLKVFQMIFFLGLCLHLIACIFRYFVFQRVK